MAGGVLLLSSLVWPGACNSGGSTPEATGAAGDATRAPEAAAASEAPEVEHRDGDPGDARPWEGGSEIASNDRTWKVVYRPVGGPIRRGETFTIEAWVFAAGETAKPRTDVSLAVDAGMPQHGHGMNRVPRIEKQKGGRFEAQGLLFHMSGKWALYFDVGSGPLVERAQTDVEVE